MRSILRSKMLLRMIAVIVLVTLVNAIPVQAAFWDLTGDVGSHDPTLIKEGSLWWSPYTGTGLAMKYSSDGLAWHNGVQVFASELAPCTGCAIPINRTLGSKNPICSPIFTTPCSHNG